MHNKSKTIREINDYLSAIGFSSLPVRDSDVTLQNDSMNRILALGFKSKSLARKNCA